MWRRDVRETRTTLRTYALTLLRVGVGIIMATHGWMKLMNIERTQHTFASMGIPVPDIAAYLTIAGELLGGIGLVFGILTPIAAFGVLFVMIAAIAFVHWPHGLMGEKGGFEYPLTMGLVALYFALRGAGPLSVDAWLAQNRPLRRARRVPGQHPLEVGV